MIEAALFTFAIASMIHLVWKVIRSSKPGAKRSLGLFSYPDIERESDPAGTPGQRG